MFPENRWYTHITIMSLSFVITAVSRPYKDTQNNMVLLFFCIIDILGAISAWQSSGGEPSTGIQIVFILALLIVFVVVVVLAFKKMCGRIKSLNNDENSCARWKEDYTTCEVVFLSPILLITFLGSLVANVFCGTNRSTRSTTAVQIQPTTRVQMHPLTRTSTGGSEVII